MLHEEIINQLDLQTNSEKSDGNDVQYDRHIQNSNTESSNELEPSSGKEQGAKPRSAVRPPTEPMKTFPLGMVLQACPAIADYGHGGSIGSWRELMVAAVVIRSMLGISPSAYQEACEVMGPENAAVAVACILERAGQISSAGGYLRDLTSKAPRGEFSLGPMLMALYRGNGSSRASAGRG